VADPEFYNGGRTVEAPKALRVWGLGRRLCPSTEKNEFLPETGGFGAF